MWEIRKNTKVNIISELSYKDFASLRVEKRYRNSIEYYTLFITINGILNEDLDFYKLSDMGDILTFVKNEIEYFEANIDEMSDGEYDKFIDNFIKKINEY